MSKHSKPYMEHLLARTVIESINFFLNLGTKNFDMIQVIKNRISKFVL